MRPALAAAGTSSTTQYAASVSSKPRPPAPQPPWEQQQQPTPQGVPPAAPPEGAGGRLSGAGLASPARALSASFKLTAHGLVELLADRTSSAGSSLVPAGSGGTPDARVAAAAAAASPARSTALPPPALTPAASHGSSPASTGGSGERIRTALSDPVEPPSTPPKSVSFATASLSHLAALGVGPAALQWQRQALATQFSAGTSGGSSAAAGSGGHLTSGGGASAMASHPSLSPRVSARTHAVAAPAPQQPHQEPQGRAYHQHHWQAPPSFSLAPPAQLQAPYARVGGSGGGGGDSAVGAPARHGWAPPPRLSTPSLVQTVGPSSAGAATGSSPASRGPATPMASTASERARLAAHPAGVLLPPPWAHAHGPASGAAGAGPVSEPAPSYLPGLAVAASRAAAAAQRGSHAGGGFGADSGRGTQQQQQQQQQQQFEAAQTRHSGHGGAPPHQAAVRRQASSPLSFPQGAAATARAAAQSPGAVSASFSQPQHRISMTTAQQQLPPQQGHSLSVTPMLQAILQQQQQAAAAHQHQQQQQRRAGTPASSAPTTLQAGPSSSSRPASRGPTLTSDDVLVALDGVAFGGLTSPAAPLPREQQHWAQPPTAQAMSTPWGWVGPDEVAAWMAFKQQQQQQQHQQQQQQWRQRHPYARMSRTSSLSNIQEVAPTSGNGSPAAKAVPPQADGARPVQWAPGHLQAPRSALTQPHPQPQLQHHAGAGLRGGGASMASLASPHAAAHQPR